MRKKLIVLVSLSLILIIVLVGCNAHSIIEGELQEIELSQYNNSYNIYVDCVNGEDTNTGEKHSPFRTINFAIDKVKDIPLQNNHDSLKINLAKGDYDVSSTINITPQHTKLPLIIEGVGNKKSILTASHNFSGGWTYVNNGIYRLNVGKNLDFRTFYVNDKLKVRARYPNISHDPEANIVKGKWNDNKKTIELDKSIMKALGSNIASCNYEDLEVFIMEQWTQSIAKTTSAELLNNTVGFNLTGDNEKLFFEKRSTKMDNPNVWIENNYELLDVENEWYYDDISGNIFYKPNAGENINNSIVSIPKLDKIINIDGKFNNKVEGVKFSNLSIQYSNWTYPTKNGMVEGQATNYSYYNGDNLVTDMPSAGIEISYADNVEFVGCNLLNFAGTGILINGESNNFKFKRNNLSSIGGSALIFGNYESVFSNQLPDNSSPMEADNLQKGIFIEDNFISEMGRLYMGGIGIQGGYAIDVYIQHNEVTDGGYSGISLGWGWTGNATARQNYQIRNNKIYNTVNNLLFDGAEIYLLGRFKSDAVINEISGNYIVSGGGLAGLYFDEGSNNYLATNNVIIGRGQVGYMQMHDVHYALQDITVTNNYITQSKYNINSWTNIEGLKKISTKKRGIIIKQNTKFNSANPSKSAQYIINNSGIRRKYYQSVK